MMLINKRVKPNSCFRDIRSSSQLYVKSEIGVRYGICSFLCLFFFFLGACIFTQITPLPNCILIPQMSLFFYTFLHSQEFFGNDIIVNVQNKLYSFESLSSLLMSHPHFPSVFFHLPSPGINTFMSA